MVPLPQQLTSFQRLAGTAGHATVRVCVVHVVLRPKMASVTRQNGFYTIYLRMVQILLPDWRPTH